MNKYKFWYPEDEDISSARTVKAIGLDHAASIACEHDYDVRGGDERGFNSEFAINVQNTAGEIHRFTGKRSGRGATCKRGGGMKLYDKTGREIMPGDTLKIFSFTGPRRKKYYTYKFVMGRFSYPCSKYEFLEISHLSRRGIDLCYYERCDDRHLEHVEIVQGYAGVPDGKDFLSRPKMKDLN